MSRFFLGCPPDEAPVQWKEFQDTSRGGTGALEQQRLFLFLSLLVNMTYFLALLTAPEPSRAWSDAARRIAKYGGGVLSWGALLLVLRSFGEYRFDAFAWMMFLAATLVNVVSVRLAERQRATVFSGSAQTLRAQIGVAVGMGAVFSAMHLAVFDHYFPGGAVNALKFANGAAFSIAFVFLTIRLVEQLRIDQAERIRPVGLGRIVFLAFLMGHALLGCALTIFESLGLVRNGDYFVVEFLTLFLMTLATVVTGERQYHDKRKQLEWKNKQLRHIAYHDALTGLPNRKYITEYLDEKVRSGEPCFVMLIDLDRFKHVNDWLGHQAGDFLLAETAARLRGALPADDRVGRLGGDEFLVVGAGATVDAAIAAATNVLRTVPEPLSYEGQTLQVTTSVGVALVPMHASSALEAMKRADIAMYKAKEKGRDAYHVFSETRDLSDAEDQRMRQELKGALAGSDMELLYQPQMDLATGRIAGFEALLRWNRANEQVQPDKFIALAEQNGAIVGIGEWAMREACRQVREWNDAHGIRLRVSVNVSFEQLRMEDFVDKVKAILVESGLDGALLELELTESASIRDEARTRESIDALRRLGVQIGIDDFGTGNNAFSYMKRLSVDRLKIDKSFVEGLPHNPEDQAIVKAMLAMARELRLKTTAEGVERGEQSAYLASIGCEEVQGYYYSKPLRRDAAERLLAEK
jgi:diguanylate cyclase (GGDEF)-like protein